MPTPTPIGSIITLEIPGAMEETAAEAQALLSESVELRLMSEVPLGSFLSGGLDSSILVALAAPKKEGAFHTFCAGFDGPNELDESEFAQAVADQYGTAHHRVPLDPATFWEDLDAYVWHMDEPVSDAPSISLLNLSRRARQESTVLLSGEGADELFAGYGIYARLGQAERVRRLLGLRGKRLPTWLLRAGSAPWMIGTPLEARYWGVSGLRRRWPERGIMSEDLWHDVVPTAAPPYVEGILQGNFSDSPLQRMQELDIKSWLPFNLLARADKMTMAASIEAHKAAS